VQFKFQFGEGGHDGGDGASRRGIGVDAFAQGAQRNSALTKVGDGSGDLGDRATESVDRGHHHGGGRGRRS
jgi:hypothetical protein